MDKRISDEGFSISDMDPTNSTRSTKISDLCAALAKAQGEFEVADRSKENKYYRHRYEDLVDVVNASRPALTKNGLSVIQQIRPHEDGSSILHTILMHSTGQWIETRMRLNPPKQDIQTLSSHLACMKRIAYASLVGVVSTDDDDDGFIADTVHRDRFVEGLEKSFKTSDAKYEVISTEQREELEYELSHKELDGYLEEILNYYKVQSLADLPKEEYGKCRNRLVEIKKVRQRGN